MTIWSSKQTCWSTKYSLMFVLWSPDSWRISPSSSSIVTDPLHLKVFFRARAIFLKSRSEASPCTVVIHFLPFLCWTRMWIFVLSLPSSFKAKGSAIDVLSVSRKFRQAQFRFWFTCCVSEVACVHRLRLSIWLLMEDLSGLSIFGKTMTDGDE